MKKLFVLFFFLLLFPVCFGMGKMLDDSQENAWENSPLPVGLETKKKPDDSQENAWGISLPYDPTPQTIARRSLAHFAAILDKNNQLLPYFQMIVSEEKLTHQGWDYCDLSPRYIEAFVLARRILGQEKADTQELDLREFWLQRQGPDGLFWRQNSEFSDYEADIFDQSSSLMALITLFQENQDENFRKRAGKLIKRLGEMAEKDQNGGLYYAFPTYIFKDNQYSKGPGHNNYEQSDPAHHGGRLLLPLARYIHTFERGEDCENPRLDQSNGENRQTGLSNGEINENIEYCQRDWSNGENHQNCALFLARGIINRVFGPNGAFASDFSTKGHIHSRLSTLAGIFMLYPILKDQNILEKALKSLDYINGMAGELGAFPENSESPWSEICGVSDGLLCALLAAKYRPQLYEYAQYIYYNQLTASQARIKPDTPFNRCLSGAFPGYCPVYSWGDETMNCCSPAGLVGAYLFWDNAIIDDGNIKEINFLVPGENQDIKISFDLPNYQEKAGDLTCDQGKIIIATRYRGPLKVFLPQWMEKPSVYMDNMPVEIKRPQVQDNNQFADIGKKLDKNEKNPAENKGQFFEMDNRSFFAIKPTANANYTIEILWENALYQKEITLFKEKISSIWSGPFAINFGDFLDKNKAKPKPLHLPNFTKSPKSLKPPNPFDRFFEKRIKVGPKGWSTQIPHLSAEPSKNKRPYPLH